MTEELTEPTLQEKVRVYEELLIQLHTARWTGHTETFAKLMHNIGAFSYARTNGWMDEETERYKELSTFYNLLNTK